ncbi:MAG: 5-methyltetrahydropteroyltriglutamate--homocysteine S-methyltransferase, partial [Prochloraceae cyanobacterium]
MSICTSTIGYPRIGKSREVKKALEAFWSGKIESAELLKIVREVETESWKTQLEIGIDRIGIGDATLYDLILDWTIRLGLIGDRFKDLQGLDRYFAMARGKEGIPALEMTKWFDTNYHYLVPEISNDIKPKADFSDFIETVKRGQEILGKKAVPIIIAPVTLLRLSRLEGVQFGEILQQILPLYSDLLKELKELGIEEVQLHDPSLVFSDASSLKEHYQTTYDHLSKIGLPIDLVTYFDDLGSTYAWVKELPVAAISLDFTRGKNLELIKNNGFPDDKRLGAGVIDGRNIWRIRPHETSALLAEIKTISANLSIQPSASLQFVPYDASRETKLPEALRNVLSFAEQKLTEIVFLSKTISGENTKAEKEKIEKSWQAFEKFNPANSSVREKVNKLSPQDFQRSLSYPLRIDRQISLPPLPTTTIGSFPQTKEVRKLRLQYKKGNLT